ncbi:MAG: hypothetical protein J6D37_04010 [Clostridia bacterium]|nr:hypothetical protein [Clostridia bacterium]
MKIARAKILWLFSAKRIPPILKREDRKKQYSYAPIIAFKGQYATPIWEGNVSRLPLWSSVVFNEEIKGKETISTITYLVENAPFEYLQIGAEFELYEGGTKVAIGKIIEEAHSFGMDG